LEILQVEPSMYMEARDKYENNRKNTQC